MVHVLEDTDNEVNILSLKDVDQVTLEGDDFMVHIGDEKKIRFSRKEDDTGDAIG
jgi:hypothetical protein